MNDVMVFKLSAATVRIRWDAALERLKRANAANIAAAATYAEANETYYAARPKPGRADGVVSIYSGKADAEPSVKANRKTMKALAYVASLEAHTVSLRELVEAIDALVGTPAPDVAAAICKLEIAIEHDLNASGLSSLLDDLRRHAGQTA